MDLFLIFYLEFHEICKLFFIKSVIDLIEKTFVD